MHDNFLIAGALTVSALGIVGLLYALIILEVPLSNIHNSTQADDGATLRVKGTIERIRVNNQRMVLTISQPDTLDILVDQNISVKENDCIIVQGKKSTYRDNAQITAAKITRCG